MRGVLWWLWERKGRWETTRAHERRWRRSF
jgi:hypothetical protein